MLNPLLAVAGGAFLATALGGFIWAIYSRRKHGLEKRAAGKKPYSPIVLSVTLRDRYLALLEGQGVPNDAQIVTGAAFSNGVEPMRQYCWIADGELALAPMWEGVELRFGTLSPENAPLFAIRIPLEYIISYFEYRGLGGRCCVLQYRSLGGMPLMMGFSVDTLYVFDQLIPELAHSCQIERQYTRSQQNIQDINEIFLRLKELRLRELISEEEYCEKKKQILIKM